MADNSLVELKEVNVISIQNGSEINEIDMDRVGVDQEVVKSLQNKPYFT